MTTTGDLEDVEREAVVHGGGTQTRTNVGGDTAMPAPEVVGRGQRLGHGRREMVAECPVPVLQHGHRPCQVPEVEHVDVAGEGNELCSEARWSSSGRPTTGADSCPPPVDRRRSC